MKAVELIPYPHCDLDVLSTDLFQLIRQPETRQLLRQRRLWGVIARYATLEKAHESVVSAHEQHGHRTLGAYAVQVDGVTLGSASIEPDLRLDIQRTGLPPRIAKAGVLDKFDLSSHYAPLAGSNVSAYLAADADQTLYAQVYKQLLDGVSHLTDQRHAWTVERRATPIADQIATVMTPTDHGRFNDQASNLHPVPISTLFQYAPHA